MKFLVDIDDEEISEAIVRLRINRLDKNFLTIQDEACYMIEEILEDNGFDSVIVIPRQSV